MANKEGKSQTNKGLECTSWHELLAPSHGGCLSFLPTGPCQTSGARYLPPQGILSTVRQPHLCCSQPTYTPSAQAQLLPAGVLLEVLTRFLLERHADPLRWPRPQVSKVAGIRPFGAVSTSFPPTG